MHATDIVAYTYQAETLCPGCTLDRLCVPDTLRAEQSHQSIIEALAVARGIDHMHEETFDSGDFPKVVFASQLEGGAHHPYVSDPQGDEDFCAHVGDEGRCGWGFEDHAERCDGCGEELL